MNHEIIAEIRDLSVVYHTEEDDVHALNGVSLKLYKGETLGLVGETGAGKTTTALSIMRLLPKRVGEITSGEIYFEGRDLLKCTEADMRAIRGAEISMIFQDPMTSLNPVLKVGEQIAESIRQHEPDMKKPQVEKRVEEILEMVGIPASRKNEYPHQFSGGMKQRVVIAMSIACSPELILADEPTTALDVTIQAQILRLMGDLRRDHGTAILLITHNMGVVAQLCDYVYVMYAGQIVEAAETFALFRAPRHPYTQGLLKAIPSLEGTADRLYTIRGSVPDPRCPLPGCRFCPRCDQSRQDCARQVPDLRALAAGHWVRCCHIS